MFRDIKSKVLVVDHDEAITSIIDAFLTSSGYSVAVENTSVGALKRARAWSPDIILLEITMPVMDGYDVCTALRKDRRTADVPVVFLTGKDTRDDQGRSFKSGGNLLVKKPFSCEWLLDIVKIVLLSVDK